MAYLLDKQGNGGVCAQQYRIAAMCTLVRTTSGSSFVCSLHFDKQGTQ